MNVETLEGIKPRNDETMDTNGDGIKEEGEKVKR